MTLAVDQTIIGARRMLGATLAQLREAQGRTQDGLASKVRLSRSSIANIESGRQTGSRDFWATCDALLGTDGSLTREYDRIATAMRDLKALRPTTNVGASGTGGPGIDLAAGVARRQDAVDTMVDVVHRAFSGVSGGNVGADQSSSSPDLENRVLDACCLMEQRTADRSVLILVGGYAGSGKSEFARFVSAVTGWSFLDKDTLTRPMVESFLQEMGHDPDGRDDSLFYQETIRSLEYRCLANAALENLDCNVSTVAAAPFLKEFGDVSWLTRIKNGCRSRGADLVIVWVQCDESSMFDYLTYRSASRDKFKLRNWVTWYSSVDPNFRPSAEHYVVDNNLQAAVGIADQARELVKRMRRSHA